MAAVNSKHSMLFFGGLILALLPWLVLQTQIRIPSDAAWLIQAAEHFWQGQSLSEYYFDTNPPMCFLVYLPVVWLESLTGIATWHALIAYTLFLNVLSIGFCAYFLQHWTLPSIQRYGIVFAFALATTLCLINGYGQKDHLIALGLMPFCLGQLAITYKHNVNRTIIWLALIVFIPFVLIKPHYGLLPTAILLHRLWRERHISALLRADFLVLAIGVLAYAAILWIYFQDFISIVLTLSLDIYVATTGTQHSYTSIIKTSSLLGSATLITSLARNPKEEKILPFVLIGLAALAFIPFWVQGKGFVLHYVPFLVFFMTALAAALALPLSRVIESKNLSPYHWFWLAPLIAGMILFSQWPDKTYRHAHYLNHPLLQIATQDDDHKSFFLESNSTHMSMQIEEYTGSEYASRFSANWFIPDKRMLSEEHFNHYWVVMGDALALDIERYEPGVLLLIDNNDMLTITNSFQNHEAFQSAMRAYEQSGTYQDTKTHDETETLTGDKTMLYKIYRRAD